MKNMKSDRAALAWICSAAKGKKRYVVVLILIQIILGLSASGYALLLSGACTDREQALAYFRDLAEGTVEQARLLQVLGNAER